MEEVPVVEQVRIASLALLLGSIAALAVALIVPSPGRAVVPLIGTGIVLLGLRLYLDSWVLPHYTWPAPVVGAIIVFLAPTAEAILFTTIPLAILSAFVAAAPGLPAQVIEGVDGSEDSGE